MNGFKIFRVAHKSSLFDKVGALQGQFLVITNPKSHTQNHIFHTTKLTQINLKLLLIININSKVDKTYRNPLLREIFKKKLSVYLEYKSERRDACTYVSNHPKI